MRHSLFLLLVCFTGLCGRAQTGRYVFTNYTTAQGLPDNTIQSLLADSRGFLWIGTSEGLSRFDGKNFKNFFAPRQDSLLQGNFFTDISEYKKGHLVMSNSGRLIGLNTFTETFYTLPISRFSNATLKRANIGDGWLLTELDKLYILNSQLQITDSVSVPDPSASISLNALYLQPNELWIQSKESFWRYNITERKMRTVLVTFDASGTSFYPYLRHYDAQQQEIWFCDYILGLYRYSLRTGKTEHLKNAANGILYSPNFVYHILPMKDSTWWFLTESTIRIWNRPTNTITFLQNERGNPTSLSGNAVFSTCTDSEGNLWLGTSNGISKLNASGLRITTYNKDFTSGSNGLMSLAKGADNNMYASVYLSKASTINTCTKEITEWPHKANSGNWNLFARGDEIIRTGSGNRLLAYNTRSRQYYMLDYLVPYYPDIELIVMGFVHSNGDEWYCANRNGGFVRKLAGTNTYKTYKKGDGQHDFSVGYYTSYTESPNGDLWFGVNKGSKLLHWSIATDSFNEIEISQIKGIVQSLTGINDVACDTAGNIWIAYNGSGLIHYNTKQQTALHYTIADGLPSNFITGLQFDGKQRLWVTTAKGLSCFTAQENKFVTFRKEDGLPADDFTDYCNYYDTATNQLWLGAHSTLMHFNPDELLKTGREKLPVYIDELYLNGKRYNGDIYSPMQLKSSENNLQFHFVGVDLNKGMDIEYSYQLQGGDVDWNFTGTNQTASYANLKPGKYTFTVKARYKGDNRWQETNTPLHFTIATPWQQSWWFLLLVIVAAGIVIWLLIKSYYASRLEKERGLLEKQKAVEQERTRIATDMHDDFGANLSRIKFLSEKIKLKEQKDTALQQDLNKISGFSDEMAEKMGEIVWALNQKYDTLGDLVAFCRAYASEYVEAHHIDLSFTESVSERPLKGETRRNLFLVLKESLHNTVKHAGASKVQISVEEKDNQLYIIIRDDGRGMPANIRPFANGLVNMRKRIQDCGGEIQLYNDAGMVVDINIPLPLL